MVNRRSTPGLAEAVADRKALWPEGSRDWTGATLAYAGARRAGYGEVGVVWQDLEERVLAVLR